MGASSFTRRPVLTDGKYILKYRDSTGELREQILEDTEVQGVSTIISEASIPTGEDVSDQIVALKVSGYETEHAFVAGSLQVYYNGLNISNTVTEDSNTAFSLSDHYADDMLPASAGDEGDSLWITYVKVQE